MSGLSHFRWFGLLMMSNWLFAATSTPTSSIGKAAGHQNCHLHLLHGLEKGLWANESLSAVDEELAKLNAVLKPFQATGIEGHSGEGVVNDERKIYAFVSKLPCIKTICEIGFNAGHSTIGWLVNNPNAQVLMFDLWGHNYADTAEAFIRNQSHLHPDRMRIIKGSSTATVPVFHHANPGFHCDIISIDGGHTYDIAIVPVFHHANLGFHCDLISIDGGHAYDIAIVDLQNMFFFANPSFNILLIDDTNCNNVDYCVDKVVQEGQRRGILKIIEGFAFGNARGVSVMSYVREL
jgi:hypothetical protein